MRYAVKVIYDDGEEDFVCTGFSDRVAVFPSLERAREQADFLNIGLDDGKAFAVRAPRQASRRKSRSPETPER